MLVTILWILISGLAVLFGIFHFFANRELYNKTKHINGPLAIPLIGNSYKLIGNSAHFTKQVIKISNSYNSPFRLVLGSRVLIFFTDPEQIKTILKNPHTAEKDNFYNFLKPWVGNGLVTAENKTWRIHRKIMQPTFNQKFLQSSVSIFAKNAILMIQSVADKVDGPEFEISPYIALSAVSNICESSIGVCAESGKEDFTKFYAWNEKILSYLINRVIRVWLHPDVLFKFSQLSKKLNYCIDYVHTFMDEKIQKRREYLKRGQFEANHLEESTVKRRKTTLDFLLESVDDKEELNDRELREEMMTLIVAGYDTVAKTFNFIFLMLAQPDVQEKVYNEIYNIYGSDDPEENPVKFEDLHHFEYLERVIKETMRLFPVAPFTARQVSEDIVLDGCTIPKGCTAVNFTLGLHRNEKFFPDPLKFDPDRFLPENVNERHLCAFIPFSFGTRDCIGRKYAMMSMKVLVVTFLRKYIIKKDKFTKPEDIKLKCDILLDTAEPITLRIEKRVHSVTSNKYIIF